MEDRDMSQKILIAFDDSDNAMRAVAYLAQLLTKDCRITLFSVVPDMSAICELQSPELTPYFKAQQDSLCVLEEKKREILTSAQLKAKALLLENGFKEDQVRVKSEPKKKGIARDIAAEAKAGYDLVVMGRRGLSGIKELFMGSISQKVLALAMDVPILLVN
jgi:nucleotide-binding universal stress UspA family protein